MPALSQKLPGQLETPDLAQRQASGDRPSIAVISPFELNQALKHFWGGWPPAWDTPQPAPSPKDSPPRLTGTTPR